jgi:hypothetical protein
MRKKVVFLPRNINTVLARQSLQFPIQLKKMTDEETKEFHLKKLLELAKPKRELFFGVDGNIYDANDELIAEEPSYEQKEWFVHKMKASARCWNTSIEHKPWILRWQYFVLGDYL